ncbi:MAG: HisA/HisF-related TIM barrel protein, partial [Gemmatimonadota bacterium]|nr:HisA/HisF-related TIM barrel protein [Gemmatimonadota bacterium]
MIAIPAIDLRESACVQLVGGSYDAEQIRLDDPPAVAHKWEFAGFQRLHIVDLDAATGRGDNAEMIREILRATSMRAQVGGGVRDENRIEGLLR